MMSMLLKLLLTATMALVTTSSFAQALNARWHGTWKSSEDTLVITDQNFKMGKEICRWANARPEKITACVAFYDSTISKTQLLAQFEQVEKATQDMLKTGNFKQAQKDRVQEAMGKNRQVLNAISNDTFRMVHTGTESKEKSGDCASFYFLDQQTVYFVLNCTSAPEAYAVRPYKKE
jgi:hypothetical protein